MLPYFIATQLPSGFRGLLIAAIFAAAMSTVSTSLNSSATILMSDFYERFFTKGINERKSTIFLYVTTLVWGALGTGIGILLIGAESALDAWWVLSGVFGGRHAGALPARLHLEAAAERGGGDRVSWRVCWSSRG